MYFHQKESVQLFSFSLLNQSVIVQVNNFCFLFQIYHLYHLNYMQLSRRLNVGLKPSMTNLRVSKGLHQTSSHSSLSAKMDSLEVDEHL